MKSARLVVFFLVLTRCGSLTQEKPVEENILEGNWFSIDESDSSYYEVYFSKELVIWNYEFPTPYDLSSYNKKGDSVFTRNYFHFRIVSFTDRTLQIEDSRGKKELFERLSLENSIFERLILSEDDRIELGMSKSLRGSAKLIERGLFDPEDFR